MNIVAGVIISKLFHLQAITSWLPDPLSFFLGLLLGSTAAALAFILVRALTRPATPARTLPTRKPAWQRSAHEDRYHQAVARLAQDYHLARDVAPLDQLFVAPRILAPQAPAHPEKPPPLAATQLANLWPEIAARVAVPPLPTVSLRALLVNGRRVILSAPPASGKSTLLAYCAYLCTQATPAGEYAFLYRRLPILLHVADLRLGPGDAQDDSLEPLRRALAQQTDDLLPSEVLVQKAESGHLLLLLDGWSEVNAETSAFVLSWLRRLLGTFVAITVFVATAARGFEPLLDLDFVLSGPAPWRGAEANRLGQRWAAALHSLDMPELQYFWQPQQTVLETTLRLWSYHAALDLTGDNLPALIASAAHHFPTHASADMPPPLLDAFWQALAYAAWQQGDGEMSPALVEEYAHAVVAPGDDPESDVARDAAALAATLENAPIFLAGAGRSMRWASLLWRNHFAAAFISGQDELPNLRVVLRDPPRAGILLHLAHQALIANLAAWMLETSVTSPQYEDLFQIISWISVSREEGPWRQQALIRLGQLIAGPEAPDIQRLRAIAALADCDGTGIFLLLRQLLHRSDPAVRQVAIATVARFPAAESVPLLTAALEDADPDVRVAAVHALGWQQETAAHHQLLLALIGSDELVRYAAVDALALGGMEEWRALRDAARDEDMRVRRAATQGLAAIEQPWADELLRQMEENDEHWLVQSAATRALETRAQRRRYSPWYPLQAADLDWVVQWSARRSQAAPGGAAAVTLLCEMLSTAPEKNIRATAARALAQVALPTEERGAVWGALWQAARADSSGEVREAAHAALVFLLRARSLG